MPVAPWTAETILPWGAHKGKQLKETPASYLLWLSEQRWIRDWPGLHAYLKTNENIFAKEKKEAQGKEDSRESISYDDYLRDYRGF